jgi:GntR family transcriptional regulator, transcriptional repressor for pyruvate dehydrogenase complex
MIRQGEPRRLYQQVADQVRLLLAGGEYCAGSRLPSERDLATKLGVSRPSIREALIALELEGLVEVRLGAGIYVAAERDRPQKPQALGDSPTELMEARSVIEGATTLMAAARMTQDVLDALRDCIIGMKDDVEHGRAPLENDRRFHICIAAQAGNSVLERTLGAIFDERHSPISRTVQARSESKLSWALAIAEHEAIHEALVERKPLLAQAMMWAHIEASKRRWVGTLADEA